ncbi:branched-chain amino acid transport system II carrier protein, partial [Streptococcus agalactiae]|uniref:branched-chain amino acid transport system II carrier protein n=1 Tax=Streptococcus agalactiae TaxID=1311 RepID=UPI0025558154
IRQLGKKEDKSVAIVTERSGMLGMGAVAFIYFFLILIGAMSLGKFTMSADGGVAFSQIVQHYAGYVGQAVLATLMT